MGTLVSVKNRFYMVLLTPVCQLQPLYGHLIKIKVQELGGAIQR